MTGERLGFRLVPRRLSDFHGRGRGKAALKKANERVQRACLDRRRALDSIPGKLQIAVSRLYRTPTKMRRDHSDIG